MVISKHEKWWSTMERSFLKMGELMGISRGYLAASGYQLWLGKARTSHGGLQLGNSSDWMGEVSTAMFDYQRVAVMIQPLEIWDFDEFFWHVSSCVYFWIPACNGMAVNGQSFSFGSGRLNLHTKEWVWVVSMHSHTLKRWMWKFKMDLRESCGEGINMFVTSAMPYYQMLSPK